MKFIKDVLVLLALSTSSAHANLIASGESVDDNLSTSPLVESSTNVENRTTDSSVGKSPSSNAAVAAPISLWGDTSVLYGHLLGTRLVYNHAWNNQAFNREVRPLVFRFKEIYANVHPERDYGTTYEGEIRGLHETKKTWEPVRLSEIKSVVEGAVNEQSRSSDRYFALSWREEWDANDWDYPAALSRLQTRFQVVVDDVNKTVGEDLLIWQKVAGELRVLWYDQRIKERMTWLCENVFDDTAIRQREFVTSILNLSEEEFCDQAKDFPSDQSLFRRLEAPFSLDPASMAHPENRFHVSPNYTAGVLVMLGANFDVIHDTRLKTIFSENGLSKQTLKIFVDAVLHRISLDVVHSGYYGTAPMTSFSVYKDLLSQHAKSYLFSDIGSESDIDYRLASTDLSEEDFFLLVQSLASIELTRRESSILSFYEQRFQDFAEIERQQSDLRERLNLNSQRREYKFFFINFEVVKACYESRVGYAVQYILANQLEKAKLSWDEIYDSFGFTQEERSLLESEALEDPFNAVAIKVASVPQYSQEGASTCSAAYNAVIGL